MAEINKYIINLLYFVLSKMLLGVPRVNEGHIN